MSEIDGDELRSATELFYKCADDCAPGSEVEEIMNSPGVTAAIGVFDMDLSRNSLRGAIRFGVSLALSYKNCKNLLERE